MIGFIFDENIDYKRMIAACNSEGVCRAHRYPEALRSKKDFEMLPTLLSGESTLATNDIGIIEENLSFVPEANSGVIIVRLRRSARTMTAKLAAELLERFKVRFPAWAQTKWHGLRLEIMEQEVFLSVLSPNPPAERIIARYTSSTFANEVLSALEKLLPRANGG